jgi:transcription elongation factor GreA
MPDDQTLSDAISRYLQSVKAPERNAAALELSRFARWYGGDRSLRGISPGDLERFQEQLASTGGDPGKLGPLRQFFTDARQRKLIDQPLAPHVRVRRKTGPRGVASEHTAIEPIDVTQVGFEQLQAELARLEQVEQPRAREELQRAAADKDFRENAPYDAAKQHLAELQRRVNDIRSTLARAVIVAEQGPSDRAGIGATVVVRALDEDDEKLTYTLVGPGEIDARLGRISVQSPVGRALSDRRVGETVEVETPIGTSRYRIEHIER